jgi:NAD(P)-dependent dehydrogenase (short-subunit alcohol dehydrogenase family)
MLFLTALKRCAKYILSISKEKVCIRVTNVDYHSLLSGKCIVITGGSRGIGYAIARKCISEGAKVIITGRHEQTLHNACEELGSNCKYLVHDNLEYCKDSEFIPKCEKLFGGDVSDLVLNAGVSFHEGNFLNVTCKSFTEQLDINLKSNYFYAQEFIRYRLAKNNGDCSLLFMSSETSGKCNDLPYGLTKVAINSLVGGLARRVYRRGIRVNAIAPGVTFTSMTNKGKESIDDYSNNSAAGRYLLTDEIAEVACFILSGASKCITGEIIFCDAGSHLKINGNESEYSL